jgi:hypothetical protein
MERKREGKVARMKEQKNDKRRQKERKKERSKEINVSYSTRS